MKALITGASSGIGRDISIVLSEMGYDLIVVARRLEKLEELKKSVNTNTNININIEIICLDISKSEACYELYEKVKDKNIDVLINNAGFGLLGNFDETDMQRELEMIDTNIKAVHILTKLFLKDFKKRNSGYILNVASSAGFLPGPLMATYYATKGYVVRLTQAIYEELRKEKSSVYVGILCPGPVHTEFGKTANVSFSVKGLKSDYVARYSIKKMFERKLIIIPGFVMKIARFLTKIIPERILLTITYNIQKRKN